MPITTAGDRDRTSPFGEIGARGVFVKELEEALLEGRIDVAVHSAKDMTSSDLEGLVVGAYTAAGGSPRRALRRGRDPARDADRHGLGAPPGPAARPRADALDRAAARQHRHAPAQAGRARPRRHRARRLWSRPFGPGRARSGSGSIPRVMLPEAGQGALALQVRAGEEDLVARGRRPGDACAGRGRAALRRADRRRLPRAGRRAPRRRHADGADRGRGRLLDRAALGARSRPRSRPSCSRSRDEDRRHPAGGPGAGSRRQARAARSRGRPLPADRDRAARRRADRRLGVRLGRRHERERRARAAAAGRSARCRASPRSARRRPTRSAAPTSCRPSRPRRACSPSCRGPRAACCSRQPRARARSCRTSSTPTSCSSTARASSGRQEFPAADLVILTSASAARALAALATGLPVVSIGPETSRAAREAGLRGRRRGAAALERRSRRRRRRPVRDDIAALATS